MNRSEENEDKTDDNNPKESGEDHGLSASDKAESASTRKSETEAYHVSGFKGLSESDKAAQEILMNSEGYFPIPSLFLSLSSLSFSNSLTPSLSRSQTNR